MERSVRKIVKYLSYFCLGILYLSNLHANNFAYIIVDGDSGKVMAQHRADELRPPASLTKMMTLYLIFEALRQGKITLQTEFKVSKRATAQEPCNLGLRAGDKINVKNIIYALVTRSANDMSVTIAEGMTGSVEDFCILMNQKAKALGMTKTKFYNPHGLPARGQITNARDMVILARALHSDYPKEYAFFKAKEFRYKGQPVRNHNRMLNSFTGMDGLKTGFTFASRFNICASAQRIGTDGKPRRVFAVVLGGQTSVSRDRKTAELMEAAFRKLNATPRMQQVKKEIATHEPDIIDSIAMEADTATNTDTGDEPVIIRKKPKKKKKQKVSDATQKPLNVSKTVKQKDPFEEFLNSPAPQPVSININKDLPSGWVKAKPST
jgi:D-alanyl-D-alanine carboxypeptidase